MTELVQFTTTAAVLLPLWCRHPGDCATLLCADKRTWLYQQSAESRADTSGGAPMNSQLQLFKRHTHHTLQNLQQVSHQSAGLC
jgi:hypothetical protein